MYPFVHIDGLLAFINMNKMLPFVNSAALGMPHGVKHSCYAAIPRSRSASYNPPTSTSGSCSYRLGLAKMTSPTVQMQSARTLR